MGASLWLLSCCYGRSHSSALAVCLHREHAQCGWAGGGGELGQALVSLVKEISITNWETDSWGLLMGETSSYHSSDVSQFY